MSFAHDTVLGLKAAAALVNTAVNGRERLADSPALFTFLDLQQFSGRRDGSAAELAAVREVRVRLARAWPGRLDVVVELTNDLLAEAAARPFLSDHDGNPWHLHVTPSDAPLADRMAAEAAMAFADLIRADELTRLRRCAGRDCDAAVVDLTRNRSRRFCDLPDFNCGNRENVAAYRERRRVGVTARS